MDIPGNPTDQSEFRMEGVWDKFCEENYMDKDACQRWFQSQRTLFRKVTHIKSGQGEPQLTERQKWTSNNFDFRRDHIVCHLTAKSEFRAPKGSASQASVAAGSASRWETVHMEPFQDTSRPESTDDPPDLSNLDTHTPTPRSRGVNVTSSLAESNLKSALAESQRGITELLMHQLNSRSTAKLHSKAYRYLILSRLCSTRQTMVVTTRSSCCISLWKILK